MIKLIELTTINCGECGGSYAINERYRQQRYEEGNGWNCPYCRVSWGYFENNRHKKLKRELADATRRADQHAVEAREARQRASQISRSYQRVRERVRNGVCPCCNRTFENLARHMSTKHPDYGSNKQLRAMRLAYGMTQVQLAEEAGVPTGYVSAFERGMDIPKWADGVLNEWVTDQSVA